LHHDAEVEVKDALIDAQWYYYYYSNITTIKTGLVLNHK